MLISKLILAAAVVSNTTPFLTTPTHHGYNHQFYRLHFLVSVNPYQVDLRDVKDAERLFWTRGDCEDALRQLKSPNLVSEGFCTPEMKWVP